MADQYAAKAALVAVAQLAEAAGFEASQSSVLNILAELLMRYINAIGGATHGYAELAGRTEPSAVDVLLALNDLGVSTSDLAEYVRVQEEIPYAQTVATFSVRKRQKMMPTFTSMGEIPPSHIPSFLPAFPDKHTYITSAAFAGHDQAPHRRQLKEAQARQDATRAVVKLEARMASNNQLLEKRAAPLIQGTESVDGIENPFLTPTLWENQLEHISVSQEDLLLGTLGVPESSLAKLSASGKFPEAAKEGEDLGARGHTNKGAREPNVSSMVLDAAAAFAAQWQPLSNSEASSRSPPTSMFLSWDWKASLQKKAFLANSGGEKKDAYAQALDANTAGTKHGRRAKRTERAMAAQLEMGDSTKRRVDEILSARQEEADTAHIDEEAVPAQELEHI